MDKKRDWEDAISKLEGKRENQANDYRGDEAGDYQACLRDQEVQEVL